MTWRIMKTAFTVACIVVVLCVATFYGVLYDYYENEIYSELQAGTGYIKTGYDAQGGSYFDSFIPGDRVTWVSADGVVLFDSTADASEMENHLDREEIADAVENGSGRGEHYSKTLTEKTLYYARRMEDGTVVRLARTQGAVSLLILGTLQPIMLIILAALVLSGILSSRLAKRIILPVNSLDLDHPVTPDGYEELEPLITKLRQQNMTIRNQIEALGEKQRDFFAITDNMDEGFLLVDNSATVLAGNRRAAWLIAKRDELNGVNLLHTNCDAEVAEAVSSALAGERSTRIMERDGASYQIIASTVSASGQVSGAAVIVMDVTEREQREALRREFSSTVSHELKTPLTSISGFAELLADGLVPADKVREFAGDIYKESKRLISIVDDIIKLSRLDEGSPGMESERFDVLSMTEGIIESLLPSAERGNITLSVTGEHVTVDTVRQILCEMVYNLCDNAIKYNRPGGDVAVTISGAEDGGVSITVKDTGIGIPFEQQNRVFERFYRVDKSGSESAGGTGLGLSIVKHGAAYLGASVTLDSKPGEGTSVTLTL